MKILLAVCLLSLLPLGHSADAADYCPPMPKAEKETDPWYIPESAFTKDEAKKALGELKSQVNKDWNGADFQNVENRLKMIKGYLFRVYLEGYKEHAGEEDKILKEEFCRFIRDEAFVSH